VAHPPLNSNLFGCSTGMSAGLAPRKILSMKSAERRNKDYGRVESLSDFHREVPSTLSLHFRRGLNNRLQWVTTPTATNPTDDSNLVKHRTDSRTHSRRMESRTHSRKTDN
jgi:hypothetical protein